MPYYRMNFTRPRYEAASLVVEALNPDIARDRADKLIEKLPRKAWDDDGVPGEIEFDDWEEVENPNATDG